MIGEAGEGGEFDRRGMGREVNVTERLGREVSVIGEAWGER